MRGARKKKEALPLDPEKAREQADEVLLLVEQLHQVNLRDLRRSAGLTQEDTAAILAVSLSTWRRWEKNKGWPETLDPLKGLCSHIKKRC